MDYMQEQQNCSHKTLHICLEIVSNGVSRISYVSYLRKKNIFMYYVLVSISSD